MFHATNISLGSERGVILFSSVMLLSLLVVLGLGAVLMSQSGSRVSGNMRVGTEAFYLADAGVEWGKDEISRTPSHPPNPAGRTLSFSTGTFAVLFQSPVAVSPLVARVGVRSAGTARSSSHIIQAQVTKSYDLADGAVSLRGNAGRITMSGNAFQISGQDHDPAGGSVALDSKARRAIAVSSASLKSQVEEALQSNPSAGSVTSGPDIAAIAQSNYLPASVITDIANNLCNAAHAITTMVPSGGELSLADQNWGSRSAPQLRCIEGLSGPGDIVNLGSATGAGILVIRNVELIAAGPFRWEGLVIITGSTVGFRVTGGENKEVYGSVLVNETGAPGSSTAMIDIQGSVRLRFSRLSLSRVVNLIPSATMDRAYGSLPWTITQDYWRTVTP